MTNINIKSIKIDRTMNHMDDRSLKNLIDCLEIQEYVMFLTISKNIFNQAKRYIKLRQPHISVLNVCYGGYGISDRCKAEMINLGYKNNDGDKITRYDVSRSDPFLVRAILKIGSVEASDKYAKLCLHAFPWMFRECTKIDEYDGMESPDIDENTYRYKLIEKYKKKVENTIGSNEKKEMESLLFRKLVQKHDFLNSYSPWSDNHMKCFNRYLNDMIKLKN